MKNKVMVAAGLAVVVFLAGFVPQYLKAKRLDGELTTARQELRLAQVHDLAAMAFVQASQKNYGLAAATCSQLFAQVRALAERTPAANEHKALEALLSSQDRITVGLAKGDPGVLEDIRMAFENTRAAERRE